MKKNNKSNQMFCPLSVIHSYFSSIKRWPLRRIILLPLCYSVVLNTHAEWLKTDEAHSLEEAFSGAKTALDFRLRYEDAEQGNQGAQALTLRSRFSFETRPYAFFNLGLEVDDVRALPDDDNYNSGHNQQFDDLRVEDPEGSSINQAWLAYDVANTLFKYGRQRLQLNNERFVGGDAWRQHEQTFSAFSISNESLNYLRFEFAQINQVATNADEDSPSSRQDLNAKMAKVNYRGFWLNDLSLYGLWITDHPDMVQWETATYGIRYAGDFGGNAYSELSVLFELEYARQEDAGNNPENFQFAYRLMDVTLAYRGASLTAGYERLGANESAFLVTPLGSLHDFQGANDIFFNNGLGNIPGGIQDTYFGLAYRIERSCMNKTFTTELSVSFHDYEADRVLNGVKSYGHEWVLAAKADLSSHQIFVQYADYSADQYGRDKSTLWLGAALSL